MEFLRFGSLSEVAGLQHAVTTRAGGTSQGAFASLNLAFHVGDEAEKVRDNRRNLARELDFDIRDLVSAKQIHGDQITIITPEDAGRGALNWESAIPDTDALVTNRNNLPLLILVADCAPILLVDPKNQVLALVHAGWRGALAGIAEKTVRKMQTEFQCQPDEILVGIGPCLGIENLEVGHEVAAEVEKIDAEAVVAGFKKPHLDLRGLIERDLERCGVISSHIETLSFCPKNDDRFFSHRRQKGVAGRFGIVAWWQ